MVRQESTTGTFQHQQSGISVTSVGNGLSVSQHGRSYLARRWKLTPDVRAVIETAIEFGLTHVWQEGHPSKDESHHISFSFSHDPSSWVFVIGAEAKPPAVNCVTFNKRFKGYFKDAGFGWAWEWENAGGKNIMVHPRDLRTILEHLPLDEIKAGRLPQYDQQRVLNRHRTFLEGEAALQDILHASFLAHPNVASVHRQRSFPANAPQERAIRTDLILELKDKFAISELKVGSSSEADVAQVARYLGNRALLAAYSTKPRAGVLVASNFQRDAMEAAERLSVSLYTYSEIGTLTLDLISGKDVLPDVTGS